MLLFTLAMAFSPLGESQISLAGEGGLFSLASESFSSSGMIQASAATGFPLYIGIEP